MLVCSLRDVFSHVTEHVEHAYIAVSQGLGQEGVLSSTDGYRSTDTAPGVLPPSQTVIYFEFDSAVLGDEAMRLVEDHATYLRANSDVRVRLGGHTDERGTREYNIALGERRAESVRRALLLRGVSRAQLRVVSYGEEQPVAFGSGETAWSQNRRVEFNYLR